MTPDDDFEYNDFNCNGNHDDGDDDNYNFNDNCQEWDPSIPGLALCPRSEAEVTATIVVTITITIIVIITIIIIVNNLLVLVSEGNHNK